MSGRPLPRSFDVIVVFIATQAHLASLLFVLRFPDHYRSLPASLVLLGCSLAVPLACVAFARLHGGDLPARAFATAGVAALAVDVGLALTMRPASVGAPSMWSSVAVGVTLLTLCPYRPPRDLMALAAAHAAVIAAVLVVNRDQPTVEPFAVTVHLSGAIVPAVAAAEFVRFYVRALRRRQDAVAEEARARARVVAASAIQADADARLARLRTEVLPFLEDVAAGRRPVDDPDGAHLAERLSAELRRELVEARSGAWLLHAPVAALAGAGEPAGHEPSSPSASSASPSTPLPSRDDRWPGIGLLDPQRLVGRLRGRDRAALSAVLAALRGTGAWASVSVALSIAYPDGRAVAPAHATAARPGGGADRGDQAFVTVVAHAVVPLTGVDPAVAAAAGRAACVATLEPPTTCVIEGTVPLGPVGGS